MANDFKNTSLVTRYAVKEFLNSLVMASKVDRQLDEKNVFAGKVGSSVQVRRPVLFEASDGAAISSTPDLEEGTVTVTLDQRKKVNFAVTSQDLTLNIEDANERYIKPAMQELAQKVESAIADSYSSIYNFSGTPGTTPSTFLAVGGAGSVMSKLGVPKAGRCAFYDADASLALANGLSGVFPQKIASKAIEEAAIGRYAGFDIYESNSLAMHTVGVATGTPLVNGASQDTTYALSKDTDSQTLITDGWTNSTSGILKAGDVFTIAGVNSVNRRTRADTGSLAQFVVLADADSGASTGPATLTISPPIITSGAFQTVTAAPADNAAITVITGTGGTSYPQNLSFHKNAITLATAQIDTPTEGAVSSRENFDGISIRTVRQYNATSDETIYRFDILFGVKVQNAGFACRVTG